MKVLVIGLDCASPELVFDKFQDSLPNLTRLRANGIYGNLKSCIPAITIPAWMVMMTGKSPGKLGLYGFRHRKGYSYTGMWLANSRKISQKAVWDILKQADKKSCLVSVPPSYPPFKVNGNLVSCFITPGRDSEYTYPPELKAEITNLVGEYIFDVDFRVEQRDNLLSQLYEMTRRRFEVIKHLLKNKEWDFFMFVEIGVDRAHHAFWKFFDKEHHLYQLGNRYENAIPDYYRHLDGRIGELLSLVDDDTAVLVVSDHGAKRMKGAFCINEWLVKRGYLILRRKPTAKTGFENVDVDWSKTKAWGWGGYYARIFLNVDGREPQGIIKPEEYEAERDKLIDELKNITGPDGERWQTKVFKPDETYDEYNGDWPDLMVYLDDLYWRAAGTMGHDSLYLPENDTGPDEAVHAENGMFIIYNAQKDFGGIRMDADIVDIAPTILGLMEMPVPQDMKGRDILRKT
jgi:predicted AlkP superfamily phosphohydrolase/phosphomutase